MIKRYTNYIWSKVERPLKITMWTLVGVGMVLTAFNNHYAPQEATAGDMTPLQEATYREWVDARAEWLKTTLEWQQYVEEEARSVVNTKAQSAAQTEAEVYKIMTADRISTTTSETNN